jgi:hypothetical protein
MTGSTKMPPFVGTRYTNLSSIDRGPQQPFILGTMGFVTVGAGKNIVAGLIGIRGFSGALYRVRPIVRFPVLVFVSSICPIYLPQVSSPLRTVNIIGTMAVIRAKTLKVRQVAAVFGCVVCWFIIGSPYIVRRLIFVCVVYHNLVTTTLISPKVCGAARVWIVDRPSDCGLNPSERSIGNRKVLLGKMVIVADETWVGVTCKADIPPHGMIQNISEVMR